VTSVRDSGVTMLEGGSATSPRGFVAGAAYAGVKTLGADPLDVAILGSEAPCRAAAIFTRSRMKGAGVLVSRRNVRNGSARGAIVVSGCANVATGERGMRDAVELTALGAGRLGIDAREMLVGTTGVIGRWLPMERIRAAVPRIEPRADGGHDFARAIMTTDTHPKTLAARFRANGADYTIGAVAKGVGMIHPDMATMFCFLTTDAPVERAYLRRTLIDAADVSLNMISVDGDTSTSDTMSIFANGAAGGPEIAEGAPGVEEFEAALRQICVAIARMLARDGEGATKLIEVRVEGARSRRDARMAARTISQSPLVKSAVHGCDPNWGRLMMAAGRSGARMEPGRARAWIGETAMYAGEPLPYDEGAVSEYMRDDEVLLRVDLGAGDISATAWGCDLSPEYVHINSDYTT
jgi:glutamate N-acetyltransferase/amino-acid N-acetyltransferase